MAYKPKDLNISRRCADYVCSVGSGNMAKGARMIGINYQTVAFWSCMKYMPTVYHLKILTEHGADPMLLLTGRRGK